MRKTMRTGLMLLVLVSSSLSVVQAEGTTEQTTGIVSVEQPQTMDRLPWLEQIAMGAEFADWQHAAAHPLRSLEAPNGGQAALLWQVVQDGQDVGYLVTSPQGDTVYEISKRAVPEVPADLAAEAGRFIYAGPMQHFVEIGGGESSQLYQLMTGDLMPAFELTTQLPDQYREVVAEALSEQTDQTYREVSVRKSVLPEDDALYAIGLYGMQKAKGEQGTHLASYMDMGKGSLEDPAFVVFDAARELQVTLAVSKLLHYGEQRLVGLQDPFQQGQPVVYVNSRFPVDVISLHVGSHR